MKLFILNLINLIVRFFRKKPQLPVSPAPVIDEPVIIDVREVKFCQLVRKINGPMPVSLNEIAPYTLKDGIYSIELGKKIKREYTLSKSEFDKYFIELA
jgi:hypothetical protein